MLLPLALCVFVVALETAYAFSSPCDSGAVPFPVPVSDPLSYDCIPLTTAFAESMQYLRENLPSFDGINKGSLGFVTSDPVALNEGIANRGTNISLRVRSLYQWAADVPKDVYFEYVLPFSNVNEARTDWRELLYPVV